MLVVTAINIIVVSMAYYARIDKYRYLLGWAFALLGIIFGLRYGYGNDYFSYKYIFDHGYPERGLAENVEPGWYLFNKLFQPFGYSTMVFVLTCIEQFLIYKLIRRHVPPQWYWFAVFIYVFYWFYMLIGLSMMRQFLVEIIGLYAMEFAIKKRMIPFLFLVLVGFTIHKAAILIFPFYFLPYLKTPRWWFSFIVFVVIFLVLNRMEMIIEQIIVLIQGTGTKYADSYLYDEQLEEEYKMGLKTILPFIIYFIFFVRNIRYLSYDNKAYSWQIVFGLFFVPFGLISPWAFRVVWIFSIAEILILPLLIYNERIPLLKYSLLMLYIVSILLQYMAFFSSETYGPSYNNFKTIFFS